MSLPRLTFLYPHLFKPVYQQEARLVLRPIRQRQPHAQTAGFSNTRRQSQETYAQRYGTAQEPQPPPPDSKMPPPPTKDKSLAGAIEKEVKAPAQEAGEKADGPSEKETIKTLPEKDETEEPATALEDRGIAMDAALQDPGERAKQLDDSSPPTVKPSETKKTSTEARESPSAKPLATVLEMPAPTVEKPDEHKTPHLQTPPYVHHFDTYTLVNDLDNGGFTAEQSVTMMKAVRSLLAVNMDVAREGLVSKSDVENVNAPLFSPPPVSCLSKCPFTLCLKSRPSHSQTTNRKPTSFAQPAQNSAPKSSISAAPPPQSKKPTSPTSNTRTISSPSARPPSSPPCAMTSKACSTTAAWTHAPTRRSSTAASRS